MRDEDYLHWEPDSMTAIRKSRKDSNGLKETQIPSITTPMNIIKIGCWNVRFMFQVTGNNIREFNRYEIDIIGLSEVRWTGFGELKTTSGETILYSGAKEHHRGVGLILGRTSRQSMIEWNPVNERIISARFFSRFIRTTIIQICSSTNDGDEADKDTFYEQLQREIAKIPKHDIYVLIVTVIGDANAKVGTVNEGWKGSWDEKEKEP